MKLVEALEVIIASENSEENTKVEFKWEVVAFDKDYTTLNITFLNPWDISDGQNIDTLHLTFWGVEFFKS